MTREEAISKAINIVSYFEAHFAKSKEAREDAVNIIEALEQEPCDDAISRQAAIDTFYEYPNVSWTTLDILEKINSLPPVKPQLEEQEPCEDCIVEWKKDFKGYVNSLSISRDDYNGIMEYIDELPVKPVEKMGQWISNAEDDLKISDYTCSNCKGLSDEDTDFCPKCGAKMQEVKNE